MKTLTAAQLRVMSAQEIVDALGIDLSEKRVNTPLDINPDPSAWFTVTEYEEEK